MRHVARAVLKIAEADVEIRARARPVSVSGSRQACVWMRERGQLHIDHLQLALVLFSNGEELVDAGDHVEAGHTCSLAMRFTDDDVFEGTDSSDVLIEGRRSSGRLSAVERSRL